MVSVLGETKNADRNLLGPEPKHLTAESTIFIRNCVSRELIFLFTIFFTARRMGWTDRRLDT